VSSCGPTCVRSARSRANKFPFGTPRCSTRLLAAGIEFHGEFRDRKFGHSSEDRYRFVIRHRSPRVNVKVLTEQILPRVLGIYYN